MGRGEVIALKFQVLCFYVAAKEKKVYVHVPQLFLIFITPEKRVAKFPKRRKEQRGKRP